MRIRQFYLKNFMGVEAFDSGNLDGGMFLTGVNGSGKSTLLDAIRYALLGYCNRTDKGGKGIKALMGSRSDAAPALIGIETDAGYIDTTIRIDHPVTWWAKRVNDGKQLAANRDTFLGLARCDKQALEIALNPSAYTSTAGLASVLAARTSGAIDRDQLVELCGDHLAWLEAEYPKLTKTLSGLREIGTLAYGQRREAGKQVESLEAQVKAAPAELPKASDGRVLTTSDIPAIQRSVAALTAQLEEIKREAWDAERLTEALPEGATLEGLAEAAAGLNKIVVGLEDAQATADAAKDNAQDAYNAVLGLLAKEESVVATIELNIEQLTAEINGNTNDGDTCPTCGQKMGAKASKTAAAKHRAHRMHLYDSLKTRKPELARIIEDRDAKGVALEAARATLVAASEALDKAKAEAAEATRLYNLAKALGERRSTDAIQTDIDNLQERLGAAKAALSTLAELQTLDLVTVGLDETRKRHARLDWAVKAFKDGAVLSKLIGGAFSDFNDRVGKVLGSLGYAFQVGLDEKGGVECLFGKLGKGLRPIELASTGERKAVEVAIALAYGAETGIALVDDLDDLDGGNRNAVLKLISETVQTGKVQVIAAGAWGKPGEPTAVDLGQMARALPGLTPVALNSHNVAKVA